MRNKSQLEKVELDENFDDNDENHSECNANSKIETLCWFDMKFKIWKNDRKNSVYDLGEEGVTVLVSQVNGSKVRLADDVAEVYDGSLHFSIAGIKFKLQNGSLDVLGTRSHKQWL
ncbi:protein STRICTOSIDINE SYNTHASE-LIKE 4-like [Senna tora]|uniref:Protein STRICTOSIDINE SYNTHASE-LIKE 4-like n=1 Tax=Senna tora TaxID=362788 RepID=A0A835CMC7_9FABA|nr:protein STRICTOSIDINE SYNTHASE-LIKE 4-like [Senna tora]